MGTYVDTYMVHKRSSLYYILFICNHKKQGTKLSLSPNNDLHPVSVLWTDLFWTKQTVLSLVLKSETIPFIVVDFNFVIASLTVFLFTQKD